MDRMGAKTPPNLGTYGVSTCPRANTQRIHSRNVYYMLNLYASVTGSDINTYMQYVCLYVCMGQMAETVRMAKRKRTGR